MRDGSRISEDSARAALGSAGSRASHVVPLAQEDRELTKAMVACNGNVNQAAILLNVDRSTVYRRIARLKRNGLMSWRIT